MLQQTCFHRVYLMFVLRSEKEMFFSREIFVEPSSMKLSGMAPGFSKLKLVSSTSYDSRLWSLGEM